MESDPNQIVPNDNEGTRRNTGTEEQREQSSMSSSSMNKEEYGLYTHVTVLWASCKLIRIARFLFIIRPNKEYRDRTQITFWWFRYTDDSSKFHESLIQCRGIIELNNSLCNAPN